VEGAVEQLNPIGEDFVPTGGKNNQQNQQKERNLRPKVTRVEGYDDPQKTKKPQKKALQI